jgi:polyhydroxyalkanoate synthesis regulator phasin
MKHFMILFMAVSLLISCKNNNEKSNRDRENDRREKDDYRSKDSKEGEAGDDEMKKTNFSDNEGWSSADVKSFNRQCLQSMENDEDLAKKVCPCALEKFQKIYSSLAEMDQKSTEAEGKRIGEECVAGMKPGNEESRTNNNEGGGWSSAEVNQFVNSCVSEAVKTGKMTRGQAQNYCSCMQEKFENLFPNSADAGNVTDEDMESPAMKRLIQNCVAGIGN